MFAYYLNSSCQKSLTLAHRCCIPNPFLVGISKTTLDKSLGLPHYKRDFKNKVHTKRFYMHESIIPEQIVENPNFKPLLVVKEWPTFCGFCAAPNIFACSLLSLQKKLIKYKQPSACGRMYITKYLCY